jgi:hypothetical protein
MKDIPAPNVIKALDCTDWALLAKQKAELIIVLSASVDSELLDGLLHFLDAIQDAAEKDGYPVVYLSEDEGAAS